jgi:hypothetical protein
MTRPQRRPANLRAFQKLGLVMRWPGSVACLAGFHEVERSGALGRLRAARRDSAAASVLFGGAVGVARGRGADR